MFWYVKLPTTSKFPLRRKNETPVAQEDRGTFRFVNRFSMKAGMVTHRSRAPAP